MHGLVISTGAAGKADRCPHFAKVDWVRKRPKQPKQSQLALEQVQCGGSSRKNAQGVGRVDSHVAQHFESRSIAQRLACDDQIEFSPLQ
jgi:hypothetical protein